MPVWTAQSGVGWLLELNISVQNQQHQKTSTAVMFTCSFMEFPNFWTKMKCWNCCQLELFLISVSGGILAVSYQIMHSGIHQASNMWTACHNWNSMNIAVLSIASAKESRWVGYSFVIWKLSSREQKGSIIIWIQVYYTIIMPLRHPKVLGLDVSCNLNEVPIKSTRLACLQQSMQSTIINFRNYWTPILNLSYMIWCGVPRDPKSII